MRVRSIFRPFHPPVAWSQPVQHIFPCTHSSRSSFTHHLTGQRQEVAAVPAAPQTDSQEDHRGDAHQGSREPGLLPAQDAVPSQDHLAPALQLMLQLGRLLGLSTEHRGQPEPSGGPQTNSWNNMGVNTRSLAIWTGILPPWLSLDYSLYSSCMYSL